MESSSTRFGAETTAGLPTTSTSFNGLNGTAAPMPGSATTAPFTANAPKPRSDDLSINDLVDLFSQGVLIVRAKWYWGLLAAVIVGGLAGFALLRRPVEFKAETLMLAESALDKVMQTSDNGKTGNDSQSKENDLRNHLSVMESRKFRAQLIKSFTADELQSIIAPYVTPGMPADDDFLDALFDSKITVERERGREFFTITVSHQKPLLALLVADHFASEYLNLVQTEFQAANKSGSQLLEKQADILRQEIARVEEERLNFRKQNKIISRADNQGILTERLKRIDATLSDVHVKRVQLDAQATRARADRARSKYPWDNPYLAAFANNEALRQELDRALSQRAMLASRYGPNHPKMRDADASIRGIQDNIQRNFDIAVNDLDSQLDVIVQTEKQLQAQFDEAFESSIEIEKLASRYEIIGTDVDGKRDTLTQLQKKISEAALISQLPATFMQIVDHGFLIKPRIPKRLIHIAIILFLAGGAFVAAPLTSNILDERVKGTADLESIFHSPLLGAVPVLKVRAEDRAHVVRDRTDLAVSEAFIGVSAQLDLTSQKTYPKCVLVTSTLPGEGKSTIACNLAAAYTMLGKRVVILDLDLRRPAQQLLHGVGDKGGFLTWARAGFPQFDVSVGHPTLGLHVLPDGTHLIAAGGGEAQPSHFLVSKNLQRLLDELRGRYDVVIIDTPPAGLFQDALVLARYAHERVLVTRDSKAPVAQVKSIIADFNKAATAFTGIVLNGFNPRVAHKKLAYAYHKKDYGYSHDKPAKGKKAKP